VRRALARGTHSALARGSVVSLHFLAESRSDLNCHTQGGWTVNPVDERSVPWVWDQPVGSTLRQTAAQFPARDPVVFPAIGLRWSWAELDRRVDIVGSALMSLGVNRGEHVGIWSMNAPEWVVAQFAVGRIGAVLVNINPSYRLHELEETLNAADVA